MLTWVVAGRDAKRLAFVYLCLGLLALAVALAVWAVAATPHATAQPTVELRILNYH
jgi:hypothetical protein